MLIKLYVLDRVYSQNTKGRGVTGPVKFKRAEAGRIRLNTILFYPFF